MIIMILAGLLCASVLAIALHPLMKTNPQQGWSIMAGCVVLVLGFYLSIGSPDTSSAPAMFENSGDRFDARMNTRRELIVMEALAGKPDNVNLLLELGTIRIGSTHPEEALEILNRARKLAPHDQRILEALGATYYKMSVIYKMQPRPEAQKLAREHMAKSLAITPKNTDLYKQLKKIKASP